MGGSAARRRSGERSWAGSSRAAFRSPRSAARRRSPGRVFGSGGNAWLRPGRRRGFKPRASGGRRRRPSSSGLPRAQRPGRFPRREASASTSSSPSRAASWSGGGRSAMWTGSTSPRIFAFTEPTDMRRAFQGLLALVQHVFRDHDPHSGSLYVFVNRRGTYLKAIAWDRTGFVLLAKKLERGRFVFPDA